MSAVSATSTTTLKTDVTSKVLPGDKSGLPLEIWQIIFSFLSFRDLCHIARVSKTWYDLALSIDMTRWKELYLVCGEWKHPFWPLKVQLDPPSWKDAYRDQFLSMRFWIQGMRIAQVAGCMSLLKRNRERQTIEVGPGLDHQTIKSALAVANDYDKILVHPGIYDEQVEISLKTPIELVGAGELGSVILVVCLEQMASTGRLSNLVLRAPWFTNFVLKIHSGYLQVDNCIIEDGMMYVQNPGTCHVHFCTFRHATVILQFVNSSIIRNCEFSQSDNANVIVEGYPKEEKGWSYHHLCRQMDAAFHQQQPHARRNFLKITESTTSTLHSTFTGKSFTASTVKTFDTTSRGRLGSHTGEEIASVVKGAEVNSRGVNSGSVWARGADYNDAFVNGYGVHDVHGHGVNSANVASRLVNRGNVNTHSAEMEARFHRRKGNGDSETKRCSQCQQEYTPGRQQLAGAEQFSYMESPGMALNDGEYFTDRIKESEISVEHRFRTSSDSYKTQESGKKGKVHQQQQDTTDDHWLEITDETKEWHAERGNKENERGRERSHFSMSDSQQQRADKLTESNSGSVLLTCDYTKSSTDSGDQRLLCDKCALSIKTTYVNHTDEYVPASQVAKRRSSITWSCDAHVTDPSFATASLMPGFATASLKQSGNNGNNIEGPQVDETAANSGEQSCGNAAVLHDCQQHPNTRATEPQEPLHHCSEGVMSNDAGASPPCPDCSFEAADGFPREWDGRGNVNTEPPQCNDGQAYILRQKHNPPVLDHHNHQHQHHQHYHHYNRHHHHHSQQHHIHHQHHDQQHHDHQNINHGHGEVAGVGPMADAAELVSQRSFHSSQQASSSSDDDDLSLLDGLESGGTSSAGSNLGYNSSSSSDEDVEDFYHRDQMYDGSDGEESVIMLPHLRQKHLEASLSANAVSADVGSICSQTTRPITLSASQDEGVLSYVNKVRGCLIHQCRMNHSKGGVMVSLQGHALVSECDISNVSYGIRCIQNAQVVILKNRIHHCHTSGIFMRLAASGLITGNDIHSNNEAGIDIRKNADPIIRHNRIHHGKRSGIVVLGSGRGQIRSNDIFSNTEAGIYILYGGNPTVSENQIYDGRAAGVAVNESGRGFIFDNTITGNQWGGVDIRRGSCPMVCRNTITNGLGDGIVIGDQGQGTIENNVISDNAGCGVWLMSASRPYIHGNQISSNGDTGVMMVNKTDIHHEGAHLLPAGADSLDPMGRSLSVVDSVDGDMPTPRPKCQHTTVQHNNIYHNAGRGVVVELGDTVDIMFNAIYANQHDGVWVSQDAPVSLCGNSISSNRGCGVIIAHASTMQVAGNGIYDNRDCGIHCRSNADITENDVVGNHTGGIILESRHVNRVCGNRIQTTAGPAVRVGASVVEGVVTDNVIFDSGGGDVVDVNRRAVVRDNEVMRPKILQEDLATSGKLSRDSTFNKSHFLSNPPGRPIIEPPPPPSALPAHNISAITKVMVPSGDTCQEGSKLCQIL